MEQRRSPPDGASAAPPPWIQRQTPYAPGRRAKMLEHMARARSLPQPQTMTPTAASRTGSLDILVDALGHVILFGALALLFQSRIPLYLGAFLFLDDGERIERALGTIGIRLEPNTIGPDIIKAFVSLFGWFALLASLRAPAPAWLAAWMPPDTAWSFIAGTALVLAIIEALAKLAMRHALPWFGLQAWPDSLGWTAIKFAVAVGVLALLMLLG